MAVTGKTGADAINKDVHHITRLIAKYAPKLDAVISAAQTAGVISAEDAGILRAWIAGAQAAAVIWAKLAGYSGF